MEEKLARGGNRNKVQAGHCHCLFRCFSCWDQLVSINTTVCVDRSDPASSSHLANAAFTAVSPASNVSLNEDGCVQA